MNIVFTLRYSYSPQAFGDTFTREFSPEAHKGKSESDWCVSKTRIAISVFVARALSFYSSFLLIILIICRSFPLHFFTLISRKIKLEFSFYSLEDFPTEGEYFFSHKQNIPLIISIHTSILPLFLFRARIHLLLQFLTRLNSNLPLIVTHDWAKRSGTFAGVLLQTNILLLTYPTCRSSLPRAETWNVTYSNTSLGTRAHIHTSRPIKNSLARDRMENLSWSLLLRRILLYVSSNFFKSEAYGTKLL